MATCEMCGRSGRIKAKVEGVDLVVCQNCSKYGQIKREGDKIGDQFQPRSNFKVEEEPLKVVKSFPEILMKARQKKGLSQEEFAKSLNERESIIAKWEQGKMVPGIDIAKRLEKILRMKLVEKDETISEIKYVQASQEELTLGDIIKIKKRVS